MGNFVRGVQVDFVINGNLSWVEFGLFWKKYVNFNLLFNF